MQLSLEQASSGTRWLSDESWERGVPFAVVAALTKTAKAVSLAARAEAQRSMSIRTPYTLRGITFEPARTGGEPVATIWGSPVSSHSGVPYLSLQAVGGTKRPLQGNKFVAIPAPGLRRSPGEVIPVSKLLPAMAARSARRVTAAHRGIYLGSVNRATKPFWLHYQHRGKTILALAQHNEQARVARERARWQARFDKETKRAAYSGRGKVRAERAAQARARLLAMGPKPAAVPRTKRLKFLWTLPVEQQVTKRYEFFAVAAAVALREFPIQLIACMDQFRKG